jgi:tetratricopeptide (TPR) repeat protein
MADVFVSYARGDEALARTIAEQLEAAGFTTWWDSALLPHSSFSNVIEDEIRDAKAVLVLWSETAVKSQWVRAEAELARGEAKLIQLAIGAPRIPLPFNQYQTADLSGWRGDPADAQWAKVLASVAHFAGSSGNEAAPASAIPVKSKPAKRRGLSGRRPVLALAGAAIIMLAGAGLLLVRGMDHGEARGPRIALQPFRTIGDNRDLGNFAAELSDSLQNVLTDDQLQTLSPAEAATLQGNDSADRLKRLGVGLMFSGTVEDEGPDLAVSMRLDDPVEHATLWTAKLSQPLAQSQQLQARAGALTVAVLNCSSQALAPSVRISDAALQAFLHACELSETTDHGQSGLRAAYAMLDAMRQAASGAPDFAPAHSMLAKHIAFVLPLMPADQAATLRSEADQQANLALKLDPKDPDGFVALGLLAPPLDFAGREALFRKSLASNPGWPHANGFLGNVMTDVGRLEDAEELYERAAAANPQSVDWAQQAADGLVWIGRADQADRDLAKFAQLWPNNAEIWGIQLESLMSQRRWGDALRLLDRAGDFGASVSPAWVAGIRTLLKALQSGDAGARNAVRESLIASSASDPQQAISRLSLLGFDDDAFAVGARYSPGPSDGPSFLFQPETAGLRRDPRFMQLAARFKLIDYWRRTGHWPDFCRDPRLPYVCTEEAAKLTASPPR